MTVSANQRAPFSQVTSFSKSKQKNLDLCEEEGKFGGSLDFKLFFSYFCGIKSLYHLHEEQIHSNASSG